MEVIKTSGEQYITKIEVNNADTKAEISSNIKHPSCFDPDEKAQTIKTKMRNIILMKTFWVM
ncbi:MAG: hypothetical protein MJ235_08315 [archaeon]|nr:hypothetical protein [archaeon]